MVYHHAYDSSSPTVSTDLVLAILNQCDSLLLRVLLRFRLQGEKKQRQQNKSVYSWLHQDGHRTINSNIYSVIFSPLLLLFGIFILAQLLFKGLPRSCYFQLGSVLPLKIKTAQWRLHLGLLSLKTFVWVTLFFQREPRVRLKSLQFSVFSSFRRQLNTCIFLKKKCIYHICGRFGERVQQKCNSAVVQLLIH